jgi:hypothetical protein
MFLIPLNVVLTKLRELWVLSFFRAHGCEPQPPHPNRVVLSTDQLSPHIRIGMTVRISELVEVRDLCPQPRDFEIQEPDEYGVCLDWWL